MGRPQNPFSIAIIIVMCLIKNSKLIIATITSSIQQDTIHGPKFDNTNRESIKGFPKGSDPYGDGALILGNKKGSHLIIKVGQRTLSTAASAAMSSKNYISGKDLMLKMKVCDGKYYELYKLICNEDILFGAYQTIKSKPGNMTPGTDGQILDGIPKNKIGKIAAELTNETFQFKPSERIWIPKANGKMRPLGTPAPMDKIVQKAMGLILELIYEPEFSQLSHGFRPNRGCHTAMSQL
jgi:Reverse transcriptase (RNA-dependent DNA polymerase)